MSFSLFRAVSSFETAWNIELLNIYKKDDFNKDIVSSSEYPGMLTSI